MGVYPRGDPREEAVRRRLLEVVTMTAWTPQEPVPAPEPEIPKIRFREPSVRKPQVQHPRRPHGWTNGRQAGNTHRSIEALKGLWESIQAMKKGR